MYLLAKPSQFPEWIATVAFYKAVQIVEAVFRSKGYSNCHDHVSRLAILKREPFRTLHTDYRPLYSASLIARYLEHKCDESGKLEAYSTFTDYMSSQQVIDSLIRKRLVGLEGIALQHFLDEDCKTNLKKIHVPDLPVVA